MDEEVMLLEEQLAAAQQEIESLQSRLAEAESLASERTDEVSQLRLHAGALEEALAAQSGEMESLRSALAQSQADTREAAQRYRASLLEQEPGLPVELIVGNTVAEVDAAVSQARLTVAQVRQHLEDQAQALRVPAGAPVRGAPDSSEMTAAEKIRHGLRSLA